jgi:hypothetical protein
MNVTGPSYMNDEAVKVQRMNLVFELQIGYLLNNMLLVLIGASD